MSRQAQHWGNYCPSLDAWVKVKILAEIEKQRDLSYKGDKQWFSWVEGDETDFHKKKQPKEVPDHWKLANKIQKLIFYSLQDSKAHLRQPTFSEQINTPDKRKQRGSKSFGKPRQVKHSSSQTLNKCWFSVDLNPYSSFNVNIY